MGDRFAHQAKAQLAACVLAAEADILVAPVWNKSNREHIIIGSDPSQTRASAEEAVRSMGWTQPYFLDADHITSQTVERFLAPCDFFTMDVAESIGQAAAPETIDLFIASHPELIGTITIPGVAQPFQMSEASLRAVVMRYLRAIQEAAAIYRIIVKSKGEGNFVPEISMDETDLPQTPAELLIILAAIGDEKLPIQTIAPKFTGRFNKGVDYVGDVAMFEREFRDDIAAIAFAVEQYALPANLKLSVHSGSDKFSIYPAIHRVLLETGAGIHLKTAGTTWLEELIGLAESGGEGLAIAKEIYSEAFAHAEELSVPYASVIDVKTEQLPSPAEVHQWISQQFVEALRHDPSNSNFNPSFRQLLHVGFKIAARMGQRYLDMLEVNEAVISKNVTFNLFERHIRPIFLGTAEN
jgi:hypothetical protein